jgi:type IV secretory pathway TrbD component
MCTINLLGLLGVRWCGLMLVSSDLRFSSLAMISTLLRWSFRSLSRWIHVCLLHQVLIRQALLGSTDRRVRTATRLRFALVSIVVASWSKNLSIMFITFSALSIVVDDY